MTLLHSELDSVRYGLRSFIFSPQLEGAVVQHDRVDLVRKLPMLVNTKAESVIFTAVRFKKVRYRGSIWRKAGSCFNKGITRFDAARGNTDLRLLLPIEKRSEQQGHQQTA